MSTNRTGDDVYQPAADGSDLYPEVDRDDVLDEQDADAVLDEGYSPPERPVAMTGFGTTAAEQRRGESLDQRLAQEEPEVWAAEVAPGGPAQEGELPAQVGDRRAGRLVEPDEGVRGDTEADAVARDVGIDSGAASAEEAAVHIVEEGDLA